MSRFIKFWSVHFLKIEFVSSLLLWVAFVLLGNSLDVWGHVESLWSGNSTPVYSTLATVYGVLLGFIVTITFIVLGIFPGNPRLDLISKSVHFPMLWKIFDSTIQAFVLATVITLMGLVLGRDHAPAVYFFYLTVGISFLCAFRFARFLWVLKNLMKLMTSPLKDNG